MRYFQQAYVSGKGIGYGAFYLHQWYFGGTESAVFMPSFRTNVIQRPVSWRSFANSGVPEGM